MLIWKCASPQGVQFFISDLASWLRTRPLERAYFSPFGAIDHWKDKVFRDFPTFSRTCIFFLLTFSDFFFFDLLFSSFLFSSLTFSSDSSHLCFSSVHIVEILNSITSFDYNISLTNDIHLRFLFLDHSHAQRHGSRRKHTSSPLGSNPCKILQQFPVAAWPTWQIWSLVRFKSQT